MSYWSQFPDFDHDGAAPIKEEFRRLAQLNDWVGNDPQKRKTYRREWNKCFLSEFTKHYGNDDSSVEGWQALCEAIGLDDVPQSVKECRRVGFLLQLPTG
jgi:hypothetical protein